jgi:hypothetical protein
LVMAGGRLEDFAVKQPAKQLTGSSDAGEFALHAYRKVRSMMRELGQNRIRRLIQLYVGGGITELELSWQIAECAISPDFFLHLDEIPAKVMQRLREIAAEAQAHPEDYAIIRSVCGSPDFDYETYEREQREVTYWSARRLREFFYPERPLPEFKPLKLVGVVEDAIELDGTIVIFGEIESSFIRRHPIRLVTPDGRIIVTSASERGFLKQEPDGQSDDPYVQSLGRLGIWLDRAVGSTSEVPPGTEVWVDRTAVQRLPDPPWARQA